MVADHICLQILGWFGWGYLESSLSHWICTSYFLTFCFGDARVDNQPGNYSQFWMNSEGHETVTLTEPQNPCNFKRIAQIRDGTFYCMKSPQNHGVFLPAKQKDMGTWAKLSANSPKSRLSKSKPPQPERGCFWDGDSVVVEGPNWVDPLQWFQPFHHLAEDSIHQEPSKMLFPADPHLDRILMALLKPQGFQGGCA